MNQIGAFQYRQKYKRSNRYYFHKFQIFIYLFIFIYLLICLFIYLIHYLNSMKRSHKVNLYWDKIPSDQLPNYQTSRTSKLNEYIKKYINKWTTHYFCQPFHIPFFLTSLISICLEIFVRVDVLRLSSISIIV